MAVRSGDPRADLALDDEGRKGRGGRRGCRGSRRGEEGRGRDVESGHGRVRDGRPSHDGRHDGRGFQSRGLARGCLGGLGRSDEEGKGLASSCLGRESLPSWCLLALHLGLPRMGRGLRSVRAGSFAVARGVRELVRVERVEEVRSSGAVEKVERGKGQRSSSVLSAPSLFAGGRLGLDTEGDGETHSGLPAEMAVAIMSGSGGGRRSGS